MSVSVSRESISKLMTELADSFPMEAEGRSSISDFGKLLFAEGHTTSTSGADSDSVKKEVVDGANDAMEEDDDAVEIENDDDEDDDDDDEEEEVDDEMTPAIGAGFGGLGSGAAAAATLGTKRVFTEIKGVPRQKHHDVQCVVTDSGKIAISHGSMNKLMKAKDKAVPKRWTPEEDERLRQAVGKHGERNWKSIAEEVPGRNHTQCLQRWTKVLAPGLVKGHWRPDEDELLKELVAEGRKNWGQVANRIPGRTSKQCRERWYNHLDPSIVRGEYTSEEDRIIVEAQSRLGNKWSTIAAMLPGRTEDAVKIRWKSLCRVRKGQNRRSGGGDPDKPKGGGNNNKPMTPSSSSSAGSFSGFNGGNMVKSEELRSFASIPTQVTPMGRVPMMQPQMMGGHPGMGGGGGGMPTMVAYAPHGSYPATGYGGKTVMMTPVNAYGQPMAPMMAVPATDFNIDRRANVVNISSPSTGRAYRQVYATTGAGAVAAPPSYSMDANGNVYSLGGGGMPATYMTGANGAVYRVPSPHAPMMATHLHGQPTMMTTSYGYAMPSPENQGYYSMQGVGAMGHHPGDQYAAAAQYNQSQAAMQQNAMASGTPTHQQQQQQYQQQQQQQYQQEGQPTSGQADAQSAKQQQQTTSKQAASGPPSLAAAFAQSLGSGNTPKAATPTAASPAAMFAQKLGAKSATTPVSSSSTSSVSSPAMAFAQKAQAAAAAASSSVKPPANPAAMFAQGLSAKSSTPTSASASSSSSSSASNNKPSPVAAFLQKQNAENASGSGNATSTTKKPFYPAVTFGQHLVSSNSGGKPPMPSSSFSVSASSVKSADDDDGLSEDGDEPSHKKVKPRNSIDMAARASAARRMRNSGTGNTLMGRRSLDVFLNEIGDVGRISDLKMDEFQTMEELWRVSGDMDRLSL